MKKFTWEELKERSFEYSILKFMSDNLLKEQIDNYEYIVFFKETGNTNKEYRVWENSIVLGDKENFLDSLRHYFAGNDFPYKLIRETYRGDSTGDDDRGWVVVPASIFKDNITEKDEFNIYDELDILLDTYDEGILEEPPLKKETSRITWRNLLAYSYSFNECKKLFEDGEFKNNQKHVYYRKTLREDGVEIGKWTGIYHLKKDRFEPDSDNPSKYRKDWVVVPQSMFSEKNLSDVFEIPEEGSSFYDTESLLDEGVGWGIQKVTEPTGEIFELNLNWEANLKEEYPEIMDGSIVSTGTIKNEERLIYSTNTLTNNLNPSNMISNTAVTESKVKEIIQQEFEKINLTNNLNGSTIDSTMVLYNEVNQRLNNRKENNMTNNPFATVRATNRRTVTIQLFDEDKGLDFEYSLVGQWKDILTEDSDQVTINELLMGGDVQEAIQEHNLIRQEQVNKDILSRTGQKVFLEPIRLKDLTWKII